MENIDFNKLFDDLYYEQPRIIVRVTRHGDLVTQSYVKLNMPFIHPHPEIKMNRKKKGK